MICPPARDRQNLRDCFGNMRAEAVADEDDRVANLRCSFDDDLDLVLPSDGEMLLEHGNRVEVGGWAEGGVF